MKRIQYAVVALAVAVMLLSVGAGIPVAIALAQDEELTLAGLGEQVTALAGRVTAIEERLAPITTGDDNCIQYTSGQIQRETFTKYFDAFGEALVPDRVLLRAIQYDTEAGVSIYHFEQWFERQTVTETWRGCEFVESSDWQAKE